MSNATANPLRVGLIGLNRDGWHLMERCLVGGPFCIAAAFDVVSPRVSQASCLSVPFVSSLDALIHSPEIDLLWIAMPFAIQLNWAEPLLQQDKPLIVEAPLSQSTADADRAFAALRTRGQRLLMHSPRHADEDVRRALSVVDTGELGTLQAVKWISWGYGLPPTGVPSCDTDASDPPCTAILRQMTHALEQLVQLLPQPPRRVFATGGLAASIEFDNGTRAEIDIRLDSPVPLYTGWVLSGEHGGYANGRQFTLTADGEVFDSPTPTPEPAEDELVRLARLLRTPDFDEREAARTRTVVQLLEAALTSRSERRVVELR